MIAREAGVETLQDFFTERLARDVRALMALQSL